MFSLHRTRPNKQGTGTVARFVAEVDAEQLFVTANRERITRFEAKIQAMLTRVWGEVTPPVHAD